MRIFHSLMFAVFWLSCLCLIPAALTGGWFAVTITITTVVSSIYFMLPISERYSNAD